MLWFEARLIVSHGGLKDLNSTLVLGWFQSRIDEQVDDAVVNEGKRGLCYISTFVQVNS